MKKAVRSIISVINTFILVLVLSLACPSFSYASLYTFLLRDKKYNIYQYVQLGDAVHTDIYFDGNLTVSANYAVAVTLTFSYSSQVVSKWDENYHFFLSLSNPVLYYNDTFYYPVDTPSGTTGSTYVFIIANDSSSEISFDFSLTADMCIVCRSPSDISYLGEVCEAPVTLTYSCKTANLPYVATHNPALERLDTIIANLEDILAQESQVNTDILNQLLQEAQNQIAVMNNQLKEAQKQTGVMNNQLKEAQKQTGVMNNQLSESQNQTVIINSQLDQLNKQTQTLTDLKNTISDILVQDSQVNIDILNQQLEEAQKQIVVMTKQLEETQKQTGVMNNQLNESKKQTGVMNNQLSESQKQTGIMNNQLDESKKQTQALTKFENSGKIESDSASLGSALDEYSNLENSLFETANSNIANFDLSLGFNFGPAMTSSIAFVSTIMMSIITAMSDFSMIYTAGMCLVFVSIIFGLWKFVSGSGGDKGS